MTATPSNVQIIEASAGTGKTTRLANEFIEAVQGKRFGGPVEPTKILVSTFTNKAAEELIARIRQRLIEQGNSTAAQLVHGGYVGTVNSICSKLLKDFAFEAGLSPLQNVIPDDLEHVIFSIAADPIFDAYSDKIDEIAARLGFDEPLRRSKYVTSVHWTEFVKQICSYARANRIAVSELSNCAEKSWVEFKKYLRPQKNGLTADELDAKLVKQLERSIDSPQRAKDSTKKTQETLEQLCDVFARSRRKPLSWADWAVLASSEVSNSSSIMILGLVNTANEHSAHPRLHDDLNQFMHLVFACAAEALEAYQEYKTNTGLLDFTDQEYRALDLLDNPQVQESLRSRVSLALIDEFQDTSPIQLSLFLKLAALAQNSVWVGDVKQAIYGFRGTDPQLMQAVNEVFSKSGPERLQYSYRSKKHLVNFSNDLFQRAFAAFGFAPESVVIEPARAHEADSTDIPIEVWRCGGLGLDACHESLAGAVRGLLDREPGVVIFDKSSGVNRQLVGSDIAILCRSRDRCEGVAQALSSAGVKVAMTRDGLLETPECLLTLATLRYIVDKNDRFALASIVHLTQDYTHIDQSGWLADWLSQLESPEHLLFYEPELKTARLTLSTSTAIEALQTAITAGHVLETAFAWGNVSQRSSNIDALRGLALFYENMCFMEQSAASAAGFITYIENLKESKQPPNASTDAVQILTYHASKGLEWPVVILTDLDKSSKTEVHKDVCLVAVDSVSNEFDVTNPLEGRYIRFWPWPYGRQEQNVYIDTSVLNSPEYQETASRLRAESVRLLYVGITRARDLLILAPYVGRRGQGNGVDWIYQLEDGSKKVFIRLPNQDGIGSMQIGETEHFVRTKTVTGALPDTSLNAKDSQQIFLSPNHKTTEYLPFLLKPSEVTIPQILDSATLPILDIGTRIPLTENPDMSKLGDCIHRFLAADFPILKREERLEIAERQRLLWNASQITSEAMLEMSDRFRSYVADSLGECKWYRECPVIGRIGNQRVHGVIDLLLETEDGFVIFDHKSFPGATEQWAAKALTFAGQLKTYANVLSQSARKPVTGIFIHMPVVGKVIDLTILL